MLYNSNTFISFNSALRYAYICICIHQHLLEEAQSSPHLHVQNESQSSSNTSNIRQNSRRVRFMLADGPHQPGISPAAPQISPSHAGYLDVVGHAMNASASLRSSGLSNRRSQQEEDSLDEGSGGEGVGNLQSYLQYGQFQDTGKNTTDSAIFATLKLEAVVTKLLYIDPSSILLLPLISSQFWFSVMRMRFIVRTALQNVWRKWALVQ